MLARIVFDTTALIPAIANVKGIGRQCWDYVESHHAEHVISRETLEELSRVTRFPDLMQRLKYDADVADRFVEIVQSKSMMIDPVRSFVSISRDPNDEPFINLAIEAKADYLVTCDNDLLELDITLIPPGLAILKPVDFLREMRIRIAISLGYDS